MTDFHTSRLGSALADRYRIEREIGEGGMATVYLADDLKHNRKVALKVLKPELAAVIGAERFLAEIETTANLQHPHILPLHDSGEADGFLYFVTPWIQGGSLRERIAREKQLPVAEAVAIATKVAGAVQAAHDRGVIHRDLKPANILLDAQGEPLVADFGIALAVSSAGAGRLTETGLSVGTPHYMSPEQATADRDLDARSDVYSIACVLFEALAGEPPHMASTAQGVLAKILTEDAPPLTHRRRAVPTHVAAAVARALERLPADRFESAAAFAAALNDPAFRFAGPATHRAIGGSVRRWDTRARALAGVASVTSGLAVAGFALALGGPAGEADPGPPSVTVALESLAPASGSRIDVSALGGVAVSLRFQGGIRYRPPERDSAAVLPGTQGATAFGFSPDGQWLAFARASAPLRAQTLYKLRLRDGETLPVHEGLGSSSLLWGEDGWIYLATGGFAAARQILRIAEGGGAVDTLLTVPEGDPEHSRVEPVGVVPWRGGRAALLVGFRLAGEEDRILALDPETGDTTTLVPRATGRAYWSPTGHLVYQDGRSVFAAPFDPPSGTLGGAEVLLTDVHDFALAPGGLLAYLLETEPARGDVTFAFLGSDGSLEKLGLLPQTHGDASLSPDGRRVAYMGEGVAGPYGARIFDVVTGADRLAHREVTGGHFPVWSPDGRKVAVSGMSVVDLEGDSLRHDHSHVNPHQWISGDRILGTPRGGGISLLELDAERPDRPERDVEVLKTRWQELQPALSPDERWLAYLSNEPDSTDRVYLRRWDDLGGQVQASADGLAGRIQRGDRLLWSPDGGSFFYVRGGRIVRATLRLDAPGAPAFDHAVVTARPPNATLRGLHPDGRFFLQVDEEPDRAPAPTVAALLRTNFFRELREMAGGGS